MALWRVFLSGRVLSPSEHMAQMRICNWRTRISIRRPSASDGIRFDGAPREFPDQRWPTAAGIEFIIRIYTAPHYALTADGAFPSCLEVIVLAGKRGASVPPVR